MEQYAKLHVFYTHEADESYILEELDLEPCMWPNTEVKLWENGYEVDLFEIYEECELCQSIRHA